MTSDVYDTIILLKIRPEKKQFEKSKVCLLCEELFSVDSKVLDHIHLMGKFRAAPEIKCKLNLQTKAIKFCSIAFPFFSGFDCHLMFEQLLTKQVY